MNDDKDRGFYGKYKIERTDGSSASGERHENCMYYVLDLNHDKFAFAALEAYSKEARAAGFTPLADDLDSIIKNKDGLLKQGEEAPVNVQPDIEEPVFGETVKNFVVTTTAKESMKQWDLKNAESVKEE